MTNPHEVDLVSGKPGPDPARNAIAGLRRRAAKRVTDAEYVRGVTISGTHIARQDIAAEYVATDEYWTDMPEAQPRARARVTKGHPSTPIIVSKDGELHYDQGAGVDIDPYKHPKYAAVRAEGAARWT